MRKFWHRFCAYFAEMFPDGGTVPAPQTITLSLKQRAALQEAEELAFLVRVANEDPLNM